MSKEEVEKHFHEFRVVCPILESVDYERIILSNRPDVEVETKDGRHIGIEVTDCLASSIRTKGKKNRQRVFQNIREAEEEYKAQLIERGELHTSIELTFTSKILDAPQKGFSKKFIDEIERHRENDWMLEEFPKHIGDAEFIKKYLEINAKGGFKYDYIESIKCKESPSLETTVFHLICVFFSGKIEEDDLHERIKDKEEKLKDYKKLSKNAHINEYWLVINIPNDEHYTIYDDFQLTKEISSNYDKIYVTYPFDEVLQLK